MALLQGLARRTATPTRCEAAEQAWPPPLRPPLRLEGSHGHLVPKLAMAASTSNSSSSSPWPPTPRAGRAAVQHDDAARHAIFLFFLPSPSLFLLVAADLCSISTQFVLDLFSIYS
nr:unnamed protein product [Digitaria exilis]